MRSLDLTHAPLPKAVLRTALPAVGMMVVQLSFNITDTFWVGRTLGPAALAAVSTAGFYVWIVLALGEVLSVGLTAVAARRYGEGAPERAVRASGTALRLALWGGVAWAGVTLVVIGPLFAMMALPPTVAAFGGSFLSTYALGIPLVFGTHVVEAAFRSAGDTKTPFYLLVGAAVLNVGLDPLLIAGWGPVPRLGIAGAAVATILTRGFVCGVGIALLQRRRLVALRAFDRAVAPSILRIGLPTAATGVLFSVVYMVLTRFTARFGTPALAALGVGHKIEGLAYMTGVGLSLTAATIVGQNLGAARLDRARRGGWVAAGYGALLAGLAGMLYAVVPEQLASLFTSDPEVIRVAALYLRIAALATVPQGLEIVLQGAMGGAGYTVWPFIWSTGLTASRIPIVMVVHRVLGVTGIWWTLSLTAVARGLAMTGLWHLGRWRRIVV